MTNNITGVPVRTHIFEIDLIRAITVASVVALHCLATSQFLLPDTKSLYLVNLIIHIIHYNREMFMFVTGLVLTYAYFGKAFSAKKFWLRRALLILVPYLFWSVIYVKINGPSLGAGDYLGTLGHDVLIGEASYQLYYILLALEFYLFFPFFLMFLKKVANHPWTTLSVSLIVQLVFMYFDYSYIQTGVLASSVFSQFIVPYQDRIFLTYQFFFIFGAFTAIYMKQGYAFIKKWGWLSLPILAVCLVLYSVYYYHVIALRGDIFYATSVIQPSVVIYSIVVILFFLWLAVNWAKNLKLNWLVKTISDTSFGIYFVHVFLLGLVIKYFLPIVWSPAPIALKMVLIVVVTFTLSVLLCYALLKIPFLAWTIGRGKKGG